MLTELETPQHGQHQPPQPLADNVQMLCSNEKTVRQEEGIEFEESIAPVAEMESYQDNFGICCHKSFIEFPNGRENCLSCMTDIVQLLVFSARYQAKPTENTSRRHLQEYFRWNSILSQKVGELVPQRNKDSTALSTARSRICVLYPFAVPKSFDATQLIGQWLSLNKIPI
ncbi:hypothetical protein Tco_0103072 [Tanacetum coccineum]